MASKLEGEKLQGLVCPLCLDVFENATILRCGHTFCKDCLEAYDEQHNDRDHIVCPVCRSSTRLGQHRLAGLTPNFSVNGLVDKLNTEEGDRTPIYCSFHNKVFKDIFCEVCREFICLTCYFNSHKEHSIKKKEELELDLKEKRGTLIRRKATRILSKKCFNDAEQHTKDTHKHLSNLEKEIRNTFAKKVMILQENEDILLKGVSEIRKEADKQATESARFCPADETLLSLGHIELGVEASVSESQHVKTCEVPVARKNRQELQAHIPTVNSVTIVREIELQKGLAGMAALNQDTVVVGYGWNGKGSDCFSVSGDHRPHLKSEVGNVYDIALLSDGTSVVSHDVDLCLVFDRKGKQIKGMKYSCNKAGLCPMLSSDQDDNIYAVGRSSEINIFHGSKAPKRIIHTGNIKPSQICVTKKGVMITSTCIMTPSTVTVFDRDGHVGSSITASDDTEYLLAAVDSRDSVLVARVRVGSDTVGLTRYTLRGTRLIEQVKFRPLKLHNPCQSFWSYMVSLTPNMLAFKSKRCLYFIELAG